MTILVYGFCGRFGEVTMSRYTMGRLLLAFMCLTTGLTACLEFPAAPPLRAPLPPPDAYINIVVDFGEIDASPQPADASPPPVMEDMAPPCIPVAESCDGIDQDCDGTADEGLGLGTPCSQGVGQCLAHGEVVCADDGTTMCSAEAGAASDEACDSLDNDCDGLSDEAFDLDGNGAPECGFDACGADCPLDADACSALCNVQDCAPFNSGISPTAVDECGDGIDQNCDGVDASCSVAIGRVDAVSVAPDDDVVCPDIDGDGMPNNALALVGMLANDALGESIDSGALSLFLLAAGLAPPGLDGIFDLQVVTALTEDGEFTLDPTSLDAEGRPKIRFPASRVREGVLETTPEQFPLDLPLVDGVALTLSVSGARIHGQLAVDDDNGLALLEGVLSGTVMRVDLQAAIDALIAVCEMPDAPEFCGQIVGVLPVVTDILMTDVDVSGDGVLDGYSTCLRMTATPATLNGLGID